MKRIISIILLLSLVGGLYAQKDASVEKRKIRPIVDLYIGTDYPFSGDEYELPGIPVAEDVVQSGVEFGDMNAKLLQKIEELTLYIIDLQKQIKGKGGE